MKNIRVFEFSTLYQNEETFTEAHFQRLVKFNETHGNKFFQVGHKKIFFKNYVGVIQIGNLTIEILPKADNTILGEESKWFNALVQMLHICGYLNIESIEDSNLRIQRISLIDLFYKAFIEEVKAIVHFGLIRKYRYKDENRNYLKGRIVFHKHIANNLLHKERFYSIAQVYDQNNILNQILSKALNILKNSIRGSDYVNDILNLLLYFEDVKDIPINESSFDHLQYGRNTENYLKAISLAKLIILNYSPDLQSGSNHLIGLLFDMNVLYEKTIFRLLKKQEPKFEKNNLKLSAQASKKFWNANTVRPDIVGEYNTIKDLSKKIFIVDTKWKIPYDNAPSAVDLKQMFTYNIHFGARKSILMYPYIEGSRNLNGFFEKSVSINPLYKKHSCSTYFIEIFDSMGNIRKDAGVDFLTSLIETDEE